MSNVVRIDQPPANAHVPAGELVTVNVFAKSSGKLLVDLSGDGSFVGFSPGDNRAELTGGTADIYTCSVQAPAGQFRLYATVKFYHPNEMTTESASDNKGPYYGDA